MSTEATHKNHHQGAPPYISFKGSTTHHREPPGDRARERGFAPHDAWGPVPVPAGAAGAAVPIAGFEDDVEPPGVGVLLPVPQQVAPVAAPEHEEPPVLGAGAAAAVVAAVVGAAAAVAVLACLCYMGRGRGQSDRRQGSCMERRPKSKETKANKQGHT